jgi:hypothetical protein
MCIELDEVSSEKLGKRNSHIEKLLIARLDPRDRVMLKDALRELLKADMLPKELEEYYRLATADDPDAP